MRYPIVQTGMGWVAGPRLVAATANAGGLGILASATMTLEQMASAIAEVRARTSAPFGVNLRSDHAEIDRFVDLLLAEKIAVARNPQTGFDNGKHFTPGAKYAVVDAHTGKSVLEAALKEIQAAGKAAGKSPRQVSQMFAADQKAGKDVMARYRPVSAEPVK